MFSRIISLDDRFGNPLIFKNPVHNILNNSPKK